MISVILTMPLAMVQRVVVVGSGWGGLSAAHTLSQQPNVEVINHAPRMSPLHAHRRRSAKTTLVC
jgi:NADH dehydrogenase FAD-containing subunit